MADNNPIVIRKVIEEGGHGHHGGAWKVAYADFVTAMMAFFLMLWLLATADQTKLKGLAEYFSEAQAFQGTPGGAGGVLDGISIAVDEMSIQMPPSPFAAAVPPLTARPQEPDPEAFTLDLAAEFMAANGLEAPAELADEAFEAERQRREQAAFEVAKEGILTALGQTPELAAYSESLLIDDTPEGLRIQIIDREQTAMFPTASAELYPAARRLIGVVAQSIEALPNQLSIRGHTDSRPFAPGARYDNWRLSSDRANATREALVAGGVAARRIANVMGKADAEPLIADDPADPRNRRISLVVLRHAVETVPATAATSTP